MGTSDTLCRNKVLIFYFPDTHIVCNFKLSTWTVNYYNNGNFILSTVKQLVKYSCFIKLQKKSISKWFQWMGLG